MALSTASYLPHQAGGFQAYILLIFLFIFILCLLMTAFQSFWFHYSLWDVSVSLGKESVFLTFFLLPVPLQLIFDYLMRGLGSLVVAEEDLGCIFFSGFFCGVTSLSSELLTTEM
jgi:hypothetical protein